MAAAAVERVPSAEGGLLPHRGTGTVPLRGVADARRLSVAWTRLWLDTI
jgi:hypothetical protein